MILTKLRLWLRGEKMWGKHVNEEWPYIYCEECDKKMKKWEEYHVYGFLPHYGYYHVKCAQAVWDRGLALYPYRWSEVNGERLWDKRYAV